MLLDRDFDDLGYLSCYLNGTDVKKNENSSFSHYQQCEISQVGYYYQNEIPIPLVPFEEDEKNPNVRLFGNIMYRESISFDEPIDYYHDRIFSLANRYCYLNGTDAKKNENALFSHYQQCEISQVGYYYQNEFPFIDYKKFDEMHR
ncbi:19776_t:CDS:1, partial [Gigaspora rosea]